MAEEQTTPPEDTNSAFLAEMAASLNGIGDAFVEAEENETEESLEEVMDAKGESVGTNPDETTPAEPTDKEDPAKQAAPKEGEATTGDDAQAAQPEDDTTKYLEGYTPFKYTVDGQSKSLDGIHFKEGYGAIVDAQAIPKLQQQLSRAESLEAINRNLYQQQQSLEQRSEFRITGQDGREQVLRGGEAIEHLKVEYAKLAMVLQAVDKELSDPQKLALLAVDENARERFKLFMENTAIRTEQSVRQSFGTAAREQQTRADTEQQSSAAVQHWMQRLGEHYKLGAEDLKSASQFFGPYMGSLVRQATPEDAQRDGVRPGELVVDVSRMQPWFEDRAKIAQKLAQATTTASTVSNENAARLAAAQGQRMAAKPTNGRPGAGKQTPKPKDATTVSWEDMKRSAMTGRFHPAVVGED